MAVEYQQIDIISSIVLAVVVGAIGYVTYYIFLKPCTEVEEEHKEKEEKEPKKQEQVKTKQPPAYTKKKVSKENSSNAANNHHPFLVASLKGHTGSITGIDFSSNGKYLLSCAEDRTARLWNLKDISSKDHKYTRANIEYDHASSISVSPDSKAFIVSLATERKLRVYKINKKKDDNGSSGLTISQESDFDKIHSADIIDIGISSNGKYIMSADKGTGIIIWSLKGDVYDKIDTLLMYNTKARISPCGNLVAACGFTSDVKMWHVGFTKSNEFQQVSKGVELKGHSAGVLSFSFSNDSKRVATVSKDSTWKIWKLDVDYLKGQEAYLLHTGKYSADSFDLAIHIALSHDYFTVAISIGKSILYYDANKQSLEKTIENMHQGDITALSWYADSRHLYSAGGSDRSIKVWHNPVGVKASIADLKEKYPKAKSDSMKERIEQQIIESEKYLEMFKT